MTPEKPGLNTICTHAGTIKDEQFKGAISPLYMATTYAYEDVEMYRYPRYFNTPNQEALAKKIAALEHTEQALIFSSGMAAVSTALLAFLKKGDHIVLQHTLYGGTFNLVTKEFERFGIEFTFTDGLQPGDFERAIQPNTKVIYVETPSNPLLTITDLDVVVKIAKQHGCISMIDNTFASPVNQNPIDFGIDIVIHSATKYLGGHSDIQAGAIAATKEHIATVYQLAKNLGGSLSDTTAWLLERSIKTLGLRVAAQNENAGKLARHLNTHPDIKQVYYPGLPSHPDHKLAAAQMNGFGGMLSFELNDEIDASEFQKALQLIKPVMSLAGVESTIVMPSLTSHSGLTPEERAARDITDNLLRFSTGIEDIKDIVADIEQALKATK